MSFERIYSGAPWEAKVGCCRAVRAGSHIYITGTAPIEDSGKTYAPGDPYLQAKRCFELILASLDKFGAGAQNVVRTRMYVTDIAHWEEFGRAHHETFSDFPPATTMVEVSALIDPGMLIEVEVDAVV